MDIVYTQPLKELLQVSTYFNEQLVVLVTNEKDEKVAKTNSLLPCYLISESTPENELQKLSSKTRAVLGGSVKANELAVRIKADYLLQPSGDKQFFDLGLAQKLAANGTIVVLMFEELLKANSFERHQYWKNYLELVRYCKQKNTKFIVASGTKDPLLLRPPKVREALAVLLGLPAEKAREYLNETIKVK
ncbi:MAG: RNase P subunit p30 family protein [archaeon]|jgi:RNase P/RNase MRP subunit p30